MTLKLTLFSVLSIAIAKSTHAECVLDEGAVYILLFSPYYYFQMLLPLIFHLVFIQLHLFSAHVLMIYIHVLFQHRMRPEIARLLTPHIYQDLENHPSVLKYEKIKVSLSYLICCCQRPRRLYFPQVE